MSQYRWTYSVIFERTPLFSISLRLRLSVSFELGGSKVRRKTIIRRPRVDKKRKGKIQSRESVEWFTRKSLPVRWALSNFFSLPCNYSYIFIIDFASGLAHTKKKEGRKGTTITRWGETLRDADRCVGFSHSRFRASSLWRSTNFACPDSRRINCSLWVEINKWGRRKRVKLNRFDEYFNVSIYKE